MNIESCFAEAVHPFIAAAEAAAILGEVRDAYSSPDRHYHDWRHVTSMLDGLGLFARDPAIGGDEMLLAITFHDAVYDARRGDNEEASAALFNQRLAKLPLLMRGRVSSLILATDHRRPASRREEAVIVDLDLAILGSPPDRYAEYVAGVRKEYAHVPEDAWREGRPKVLDGFLRRDRIFLTDEMAHLEGPARANLSAELMSLSVPMDPVAAAAYLA